MRLLSTTNPPTFQEFFNEQVPEYAILSHRWGAEEVSYEQYSNQSSGTGEGYAKIQQFRALAGTQGVLWVWIDTCCIDKRSSAELSEAINSMYRWYEGAVRCYAYLSDVIWKAAGTEGQLNVSRVSRVMFRESKWFTRGWTLQELLAPRAVHFFDRAWTPIDTKDQLCDEIALLTGIDHFSLTNPSRLRGRSVAEKMTWAAKRETTRVEDLAYCLMGLFDINMPLLYGEGDKAFLRLQQEIVQKSDDETIFAWIAGPATEMVMSKYNDGGIFAPSPLFFADSGGISPGAIRNRRPPCSMTQKGFAIHVPKSDFRDDGTLCLRLHCGRHTEGPFLNSKSFYEYVYIMLSKRQWSSVGNVTYFRRDYGHWLYGNSPAMDEKKFDTCVYVKY